MDPSGKSISVELWREAYEAIIEDEDEYLVSEKFKKAISKDKDNTPDLTSNDGRRQLTKVIKELDSEMQSSSSPKIKKALETVNKFRSLIAAGASANPFATIAVAGTFIAFDIVLYHQAEEANISKIVVTISDIAYRNEIRNHLVSSQPNDHPKLVEAREELKAAFVQLNRIILLLIMKIVYKLNAWHKYFMTPGSWSGRLEALEDAEKRVSEYVRDINFYMLNPPTIDSRTADSDRKQTGDQITRLHRLVRDGQAALVYSMIEAGACTPSVLNAQTSKGWTPLMYAARDGQWKIMNYLLRLSDISINTRNIDGNTALILAAQNNRIGHVKKLIENGAKLDIRNKDKKTAWLEAAGKGKLKAMQGLLEKKDDINQITGRHGWCALHTAVSKDHIDMATWLLEKGARTDMKIKKGNHQGLTPRGLAEKLKREELLKILPEP